MDIRSAYAMKLGALLVDKLLRGFPSPDQLEGATVEEECWNTEIKTDMSFVVVCNSDEHDCPERQEFSYVMDAVDAALSLVSDPREFQVFLGFSTSCNEDEWLHVEHAAMMV